jgi:hypothetical protein
MTIEELAYDIFIDKNFIVGGKKFDYYNSIIQHYLTSIHGDDMKFIEILEVVEYFSSGCSEIGFEIRYNFHYNYNNAEYCKIKLTDKKLLNYDILFRKMKIEKILTRLHDKRTINS